MTTTESALEADAPTADPEERELVSRARGGDGEAFRELVERNQASIFRLAMRVLHCDRTTAEDLCQDVFLRAYRGLARFEGEIRFGVWLHTIAMNACISEYRKSRTLKRGSRRTVSLDAPLVASGGHGGEELHRDPPSRELDPGERANQTEFAARVREAVAGLPDDFRDAVVLRDVQNLSYEEIAQVLGLPPGTVRSRIHRGRLLLQDALRGFVE
ncbi:MAG: sigma-70 family RNA polymerase sigma factor [Planctomycetes bacterium]|nr:sigma-70 family RNA polymerase sigma factor [Planctomycetota bacterium]